MKIVKLRLILLLIIAGAKSGLAQYSDIDITASINPADPSSKYWRTTTASVYVAGAGVPLAMFVTGIVKDDKDLRVRSVQLAASLALDMAITAGMKYTVNRARPAQTYPRIIFPYKDKAGKSFPSGHTSLAFGLAVGLTVASGKWYVAVPAYLWAGTVGVSRIYLGVHYPSDVLAGAIVGTGSVYLSNWLQKKLIKAKKPVVIYLQ